MDSFSDHNKLAVEFFPIGESSREEKDRMEEQLYMKTLLTAAILATTLSLGAFEDLEPSGKILTLWNGREVQALPCVENIKSAPPGENSWRCWEGLDSMLYDPYFILTKCGACDEKLVDYFYETRSFTSYAPYEHKIYGMIFHRTCSQCCNDKEKQDHIFENEKLCNSEYTNFKRKGHVYQKYTIKIQPTPEKNGIS